jgi:hypothetical protein
MASLHKGWGHFYLTEDTLKSGQSVYLHQSPRLQGNISRVTPEGIYVTWHKFVLDVPECLMKDSKVDVRAASRRFRAFYPKDELRHIGVGRPPLV